MKEIKIVTIKPDLLATYNHPLGFYIQNHNRPSPKKIEEEARRKHKPLPPGGNGTETNETTTTADFDAMRKRLQRNPISHS